MGTSSGQIVLPSRVRLAVAVLCVPAFVGAAVVASPIGQAWASGSASISEHPVITPTSVPYGVTSGPNGNIWFTEFATGNIGEMTTSGTFVREFPALTQGNSPGAIITGPGHDLWFTETLGGIGRMDASGTLLSSAVTSGVATGLVAGPDGKVWYAAGGVVGKIDPATLKTTELVNLSKVPGAASASVQDITVRGTDLWVTDPGSTSIWEIPVGAGAVQRYKAPTGSYPDGIAVGSDGAIWFTEQDHGKIARLDPSTRQTIEFPMPSGYNEPRGIVGAPASDSEDAVWFVNYEGSSIGAVSRVAHNGTATVTETPTPTTGAYPQSITVGPDDNLWFTETTGNSVGRATPHGTEVRVSSVAVRATVPKPTFGDSAVDDIFLPADVVRDQVSAPAQTVTEFKACDASSTAQWVDCSPSFPDGTPEKDWPIVFHGGQRITINQVQFKVKGVASALRGSVAVGSATISGRTLGFVRTSVTPVGSEITINDVTSTAAIPLVEADTTLAIRWTFTTSGGETIPGGTSSLHLYVTLKPAYYTPYVSLVDLTTSAAQGQTTVNGVASSIWAKRFSKASGLSLHPRTLDPATGVVSLAPRTIQYWTPWTYESDYLYLDNTTKSCGHLSTPELLSHPMPATTCGNWADFFIDNLLVQGITTATHVCPAESDTCSRGAPGTFQVYPKPSTPEADIYVHLMLIKNWRFSRPTGTPKDPEYPYVSTIRVSYDAAGAAVPDSGVGVYEDLLKIPGVPGQGPDAAPPGWFKYDDHGLVVFDGKIYDPSYGSGTFTTIQAWAKASLAGWAYLTYSDSTHGPGAPFVRTWHVYAHEGV